MTDATATPLPLRNDTILGICEALGQDFGFNANWLRVALCAALYFSPAAVIGTYLGLGVIVLASRLLFPTTVKAVAEDAPAEAVTAEANDADDLAIAA